jgi:hypothetical protein
MATLRFHFKSILYQNLDVYREPLKVKFEKDPSREVQDFSLKYVDGFTKGLIAQSIVAMADLVEAQLFFGCRCAVHSRLQVHQFVYSCCLGLFR